MSKKIAIIAKLAPKPTPKSSPNPSKASSPANIKIVFGTPKKQK